MHEAASLFDMLYQVVDGVIRRGPVLCLFLLSGSLFLSSMILKRHGRQSLGQPKTSITDPSAEDGRA